MSSPSPSSGGTADILPRERAKCSFNEEALGKYVHGNRNKDEMNEWKKLFSGGVFDSQKMEDYQGYEERFRNTVARTAAAAKVMRDPANMKFAGAHKSGRQQMADMFHSGSLGIHFSMFLTFIKTNASDEQKKVWLSPAMKANYFGAYAQTELGHGSNVRGLETTATLDKETDEFVIHSPALTSLKWWPTAMYTCTHGVVMAQLIIDGKNYGFHGFMVQFRDDKGCQMPGVEVGEMGPKINMHITNIGYARFTHVRVPRFNMFAKYQQVAADGTYTAAKREESKFRYISMMEIRTALVGGSYHSLAQAATIGIRYSCVRKQGFTDSTADDPLGTNVGENYVIDYKVQQYRLFKALATAYCFLWNAKYVNRYLSGVKDAISGGRTDEIEKAANEMPELHATLSGLKAWSTVWGHLQIEDCRKACGGQGFLLSSGITKLSTNFSESVTVEGEQVILSFQVARFLIKAVGDMRAGKELAGQARYLAQPPLQNVKVTSWHGKVELLLDLMRERSRRLAVKLVDKFTACTNKGMPFDKALNACANLAYKAAEKHSAHVMFSNNYGAIKEIIKDEGIKVVKTRLLELILLMQLVEHSGDLFGVIDEASVDLASVRIDELLDEIRPDAVALSDGFGFTDDSLNSTLGRYDGNVYEAIYRQAKLSPLNQKSEMVGWEHMSQIVDLEFLKDGVKTQRAGENVSKL